MTITTVPEASVSGNGRGAQMWAKVGLIGMPVFIAAALLLTYLWVNSIELDSIEQRTLTADRIWQGLREHLALTFVSTVLVVLIAIPAGIAVTRPAFSKVTPVILGIGNAGQAIPSFGFITIIVIWFGVGFNSVIVGLVAYSALPILRNTMVGLQQVDENVIKAARGMGLSPRQILVRVELPLAVPVMLAGIRTALIINVGTASLATFYAAGGLGYFIVQGIQLNRDPILITGVVMVASLALLIDYLASVLG
ncbi:MAG: ABC transporter permease, partial [Ornithinimicrobium sp.]